MRKSAKQELEEVAIGLGLMSRRTTKEGKVSTATAKATVKEKPAEGDIKSPVEAGIPRPEDRVDGQLPPPAKKFIVLAKDMKSEEFYSNVAPMHIGSPYKVHRFLGKASDGAKVKVMVYADNLGEWLTVAVPPTTMYTVDPTYVDAMTRPVERSKEERRARAAHLPKFQKTKPDPEPSKASGKQVFRGKLGEKVFLFDAGDGSTVAEVDVTKKLADEAKRHNRLLVSQAQASTYAVWVFTEQWKKSRAK